MKKINAEYPSSWINTTLDEVCKIIMGQSPPSEYYNTEGNGLPFFQGKAEFGKLYPTVVKWCKEPKKIAEKNDVLISVRAPVGPTNLSPSQCCIGRGLASIRPISSEMPSKYVLYYIRSIEKDIENLGTGTTFKAISGTILNKLPIPVAPTNEQKRIVAEIEKQFSRLDEAVENLQRVKANLKRYKASVLKAAVEGKLTEQWRAENPAVESASQLLERILKERRKKWEENELAKMKAKGKMPKDDKWKKRYKKPPTANLQELPNLIYSWEWATFAEISDRVTVGHVGSMKDEYVKSGIPFLRSQNVRENRYDPKGLKHISKQFHEKLKKSALSPGDIVIVRSGDVGVSCVIPEQLAEANCSDLVIVKLPIGILSDYGAYYMNSIKNTRVSSKKVGVALTHFNTQSVAEMPIPVPPIDEQREIVAKVNKLISIADEIEIDVEKNLSRAEKLRQLILKKAFSGQIVKEDPNDEPAAKLLGRINNERAKLLVEPDKRRKKGKKSMASKEKLKKKRDIVLVLTEANKPLRPEELFQLSGYMPEEVDQFYADLKTADQENTISQKKLDNGGVYLKVTQ